MTLCKEQEIILAEQEKQKMEINAAADKFMVETEAAAQLEAKKKQAEAIKTIGESEATYRDWETDRKSTRLNSSHRSLSRMPSSA